MSASMPWDRGGAFHGLDDEFKPQLEPGTKVYFTDRDALDVVDGEVFQWISYSSQFGDRYSVFCEENGMFYDVAEYDLTRMPDASRLVAWDSGLLTLECASIIVLFLAMVWRLV